MTARPSIARRIVRRVCARWLPPLAYPVVRGPLRGARFILRSAAGEGGGASVYVGGVEPAKTQAFLDLLAPGQVVFDVGANVGYYTVLASRRVGERGQVVAFEPSVRNVSFLYRHLAVNRIGNVRVIPAGCSNRSGPALFDRGNDCATGRLLTAAPPRGSHDVVATVTLDAVVRAIGITPDVLKIDVEGAELDVLEGAAETLASARPVVLVGVHSPALRAACSAFLARLGYGEPIAYDEVEGDTELLVRPASPGLAIASGRS